jgi:hypothetical protein
MFDNRRSERVGFDRVIWILTDDLPIEAQAADLSRTGVRMQFPVNRLGDGSLVSLAQIAAHLEELLGDTCRVYMECTEHRRSVSRKVHLVRIVTDGSAEHVELGGSFDAVLSDDEVASLGIELPPAQEPEAGEQDATEANADEAAMLEEMPPEMTPYEAMWYAPLPFDGPSESDLADDNAPGEADISAWDWRRPPGVRQRWRVYLTGDAPQDKYPQRGQLHGVNSNAVCMYLPPAALWDQALLQADATTVAVALTKRLGDELTLKLADGAQHIWTGRARVHGVELPSREGAGLFVTLTFLRPLAPWELSRMGVE